MRGEIKNIEDYLCKDFENVEILSVIGEVMWRNVCVVILVYWILIINIIRSFSLR